MSYRVGSSRRIVIEEWEGSSENNGNRRARKGRDGKEWLGNKKENEKEKATVDDKVVGERK